MKLKRSQQIQGAFEIPMTIAVEWGDSRSLEILKEKAEEVSFSVHGERLWTHIIDSKSILTEIHEADTEVFSSESDHGA